MRRSEENAHTQPSPAVCEHLLSGRRIWAAQVCLVKGKVQRELGAWRVETVEEFFLFDFQDVSVSKSSLNPRALISAVYFNGLGKKERRARVEQISFYIRQSESLGP